MTPTQIQILRSVVRCNGGGFYVGGNSMRTAKVLERLGYIQGKQGSGFTHSEYVVHTPAGLEWVRNNPC